jgi:hypothetical protein
VRTFPLGKSPTMELEEGWISYAIAQKESRHAWSCKINKPAADQHVAFLTVLVPYREGAAPDLNADFSDAWKMFVIFSNAWKDPARDFQCLEPRNK